MAVEVLDSSTNVPGNLWNEIRNGSLMDLFGMHHVVHGRQMKKTYDCGEFYPQSQKQSCHTFWSGENTKEC
jgi:hypothetical protein